MSSSPFLSAVRDFMIVRRYSTRTIKSYLYWIRYYIIFHNKQRPEKLGAKEVEMFLTYLAVQQRVATATQAVALNALVFLYKSILSKPLGDIGQFQRSARQRKLPVVLTQTEVRRLMSHLSGSGLLMASLLYGSGLRRIELIRLRVKDVADWDTHFGLLSAFGFVFASVFCFLLACYQHFSCSFTCHL